MTGHFSLDIDAGLLHDASRSVGTLAGHLDTQGSSVTGTPGEIAEQWTGAAATSIKAEMTGLGGHMTGFAGDLRATRQAIDSLAHDYEQALTQVAKLNREYDAAQATYQGALTAAAREHTRALTAATPTTGPLNRGERDDLDTVQRDAGSTAATTRQTAWNGLETEFAHLREWVGQQTRTAARSLSQAVPLPVPPSAVEAWQKTGTYPVRLDRSSLERSLELTKEADQEVGTEVTEAEGASLLDQVEPYRKINEAVHSAWDLGFGDSKLDSLLKVALENAEGMPKQAAQAAEAAVNASIRIKVLQALADIDKASPANLAELAELEKSFGGLEAAAGDTASAASSATRLAQGLSGLSKVLGVTAIAGDVLTVLDPPDDGVMGYVDQGAAGINGGLIAANLLMDEIPVVGEVVMIGTGLYLAGNFLYHNVQWFHDGCDAVADATVTAAKWVGHEAADAYHATTQALSTAADDVVAAGEDLLDDAGDLASSGWDAVTSIF